MSTIHYENGVRIIKSQLTDVAENFDLIMAHHSFEHTDDPWKLLKEAGESLRPNGVILLRVPLVSSWAWEEYGVDWVQLDAPRHQYLHTPKSIGFLCDQVGLAVEKTIYDSTDLQFRGSEAYRRGIALEDIKEKGADIADEAQRQAWKEKAVELNRAERGDQAAFYIRKK